MKRMSALLLTLLLGLSLTAAGPRRRTRLTPEQIHRPQHRLTVIRRLRMSRLNLQRMNRVIF